MFVEDQALVTHPDKKQAAMDQLLMFRYRNGRRGSAPAKKQKLTGIELPPGATACSSDRSTTKVI